MTDVLEPDLATLIASVDRLGKGVMASNEAINKSNDNIDTSNRRIAELGTYGKRSRRLIRGLALSVAFDILLSIGLAFAFHNASNASLHAASASRQATILANANATTIIETCENSNEVRLDDIQLWTHLVSLVHSPEASALLTFVNKTFAPRVC